MLNLWNGGAWVWLGWHSQKVGLTSKRLPHHDFPKLISWVLITTSVNSTDCLCKNGLYKAYPRRWAEIHFPFLPHTIHFTAWVSTLGRSSQDQWEAWQALDEDAQPLTKDGSPDSGQKRLAEWEVRSKEILLLPSPDFEQRKGSYGETKCSW